MHAKTVKNLVVSRKSSNFAIVYSYFSVSLSADVVRRWRFFFLCVERKKSTFFYQKSRKNTLFFRKMKKNRIFLRKNLVVSKIFRIFANENKEQHLIT